MAEKTKEHKAKSPSMCRFYRHVDLPNGISTETCKIDPIFIEIMFGCGKGTMCGYYEPNHAE